MKKICLFSVLTALLAVSCGKEQPVDTPVEGEEVLLCFKTTTPGVRTILGDETGTRSISWGDKDSVNIYYGTSVSAYKKAGVDPDGAIRLKVSTASKFYALYPHTATGRMVSSGFDVTVPDVQNGTFADACLMAAYAGSDRILRFQTAVSMLTVEVTDPAVTKVVIRANDGTPIAGTVLLSFDTTTGEITNVKNEASVSKEITLNVNGVGTYYVGILPDVKLACGIGFNVFKGEKSYGALSGTPLESSTSKLIHVGPVDTRLLQDGDVFIKANASGSGSSWTEAGGPALLKSLIGIKKGYDGVTSGWRLAGKNIYIAKGEYELGSTGDPLITCGTSDTLRIIGGFYEGSAGKELDKYDPESYPTVFNAPSGERILEIAGSGTLSLEGITFSGAKTEVDGGALYCSSSDISVLMKDCTVSSNTTTKNGAGLYVGAGTFRIEGCTFDGNSGSTAAASSSSETTESKAASRGGAIFATGAASDIFINNCRFRSNIAFAGADIQLQYGADAFVYRSSFFSSVATALSYHSVYPGRSIDADAVSGSDVNYRGKLCLCNCTISKTSSGYSTNGGLPLVAPTDYFCMLVESTLHDTAVASLRNNNTRFSTKNADLVWVIANLFVNSGGNAINLSTSSTQHGYYNILEKGKNNYGTLAETDTKAAESDFTSLKLDSNNGVYSWALPATISVNKPTRSQICDLVRDNCPEFYDWLYTLDENALGLDQTGATRNPGAMYPGAWDKGM